MRDCGAIFVALFLPGSCLASPELVSRGSSFAPRMGPVVMDGPREVLGPAKESAAASLRTISMILLPGRADWPQHAPRDRAQMRRLEQRSRPELEGSSALPKPPRCAAALGCGSSSKPRAFASYSAAHSSFCSRSSGADEAHDGSLFGEDDDYVGAPVELSIQPFERNRRVQPLPVLLGNLLVCEHIVLDLVHRSREFWESAPSVDWQRCAIPLRRFLCLLGDAVRIAAATIWRCFVPTCASADLSAAQTPSFAPNFMGDGTTIPSAALSSLRDAPARRGRRCPGRPGTGAALGPPAPRAVVTSR
jgi:hypothetical protein